MTAHLHPSLTADDLAMFARLGIPPELLAEAQVRRVTDSEARRDFGIWTADATKDVNGILFPYFIPPVTYRVGARVRRDKPEIGDDGKVENKYCSAYGDRKHLYFPPGAKAKFDDPNLIIVFVESEKAALALTAWAKRVGIPLVAIAMGGCWGWHGRIGVKEDTRDEVKGPLPDLDYGDGHKVYVLLDSNVATNSKVKIARDAFIRELTKAERKCEVLICELPRMNGVINGPDDFLSACGDEAMSEILAAAHPPPKRILQFPKKSAAHTTMPPKPAAPPLAADKAAKLSSELLTMCRTWIRRFVVLSESQAIVCAVWLLHTYVWEIASKTPYLHIYSAEKEEGKTQLVATLAALACKQQTAEEISGSALRRVPGQLKPTLFLDEMDAMLRGDKDKAEAIRGLLNSGYRAKGCALLCGGKESNFALERFPSFCPKVLAGIGQLWDTVAGRSIPIELHRMAADQSVEDIDDDDVVEALAQPILNALERWGEGVLPQLKQIAVEKVPGLKHRQQNISKPLVQIVTLAGPEWTEALTKALRELFQVTGSGDDSTGVILLDDIHSIFAERHPKLHIPSKELAAALNEIEGRPWADWGRSEKGLTANQLAKQLRKYHIHPHVITPAGETSFRGYEKSDFTDAWKRYCSYPPSQGVKAYESASTLNETLFSKRKEGAAAYTSKNAETYEINEVLHSYTSKGGVNGREPFETQANTPPQASATDANGQPKEASGPEVPEQPATPKRPKPEEVLQASPADEDDAERL